jgi:hypothetical protein
MGEDRLEMSQRERDRLKVLHEASKGQITQRQAGEQLRICERQVRRLLRQMQEVGDRAVIHGLRGRRSNRRLSDEIRQRVIELLSEPACCDFGPTFAAEHVSRELGQRISKDTVRKWMMAAGLWQSRPQQVKEMHPWRPRRCCAGELVQWDTSVHQWLEGRGERLYLVAMIDDATSRVWARFVRHDTTEENMRVAWGYLERYGRPLEFYTDKAAMFESAPKSNADQETNMLAATQMTRALAELGIGRISAHSPQAKGRIERFFATAQDRLVKGLRLAGASTLEHANAYLDAAFLPEWNTRWLVAPTNATDAHRPLTELHNLAASFSHVKSPKVTNDYTFQFCGNKYRIGKQSVVSGLKGSCIRVEGR